MEVHYPNVQTRGYDLLKNFHTHICPGERSEDSVAQVLRICIVIKYTMELHQRGLLNVSPAKE